MALLYIHPRIVTWLVMLIKCAARVTGSTLSEMHEMKYVPLFISATLQYVSHDGLWKTILATVTNEIYKNIKLYKGQV